MEHRKHTQLANMTTPFKADRQIPDRTTSNGPEMVSGIRVFGSETANSTSMPIDVEFGVLIRIRQIPDRVRKPRIRSSKGFLDESIQNQDLEWHLEWYLGWYLEFDHFCREPGISIIRSQMS